MGERVLVSTLPLWPGGVLSMLRFALECLEREGLEPVLAYYLPYSMDPSLSVRLPGLLAGRRPQMRRSTGLGLYETYEMGASLPELEQRNYRLDANWRKLIDSCRYHVAVSGNCLAARPFVDAGVPFLLWVATPWMEDRRDRLKAWPRHRRVFDSLFVGPWARQEEIRILRSARAALALSEYCRRQLASLVPGADFGVLPCAVDGSRFVPRRQEVVPGRVAFVGRVSDPRKNVLLFLRALAACRANGTDATGLLVGAELPPEAREAVSTLGLTRFVRVVPSALKHERDSGRAESLPELLSTVDVFLVPSLQEGFCIAALEAMAAGCPVVSTPCGGPEEFVLSGQTGFVSSFEPTELGVVLSRIIGDRRLRAELSENARSLVDRSYDRGAVEARMSGLLRDAFHLPAQPGSGRVEAPASRIALQEGAAAG